MIPALVGPQAPRDVLPEGSRVASSLLDTAIDPHSTRLLYHGEHEQFWVAVRSDGQICLLTELADGTDGGEPATTLAGTSCGTADGFFADGVALQTRGELRAGSVALLVPADVDLDGARPLGQTPDGESFSSHLVLRTTQESRASDDVTLDRSTGGTFTLRALL